MAAGNHPSSMRSGGRLQLNFSRSADDDALATAMVRLALIDHGPGSCFSSRTEEVDSEPTSNRGAPLTRFRDAAPRGAGARGGAAELARRSLTDPGADLCIRSGNPVPATVFLTGEYLSG